MNVDIVIAEFLRKITNDRHFGRTLFSSMKEPHEKPQKIFLLDDLDEIGKAKLKDIAQKTGHSPQNLCMLYNGFEKEGLIQREIDPKNRRNTYYSLTPKGKKTVIENKKAARDVIKNLFTRLSDQELTELKSSLEKTNNLIEKILERTET